MCVSCLRRRNTLCVFEFFALWYLVTSESFVKLTNSFIYSIISIQLGVIQRTKSCLISEHYKFNLCVTGNVNLS